jgi:DNA-binding beta-propeller fold protein YncE
VTRNPIIRIWILPLLCLTACVSTSPEPVAKPAEVSNLVWPSAPEQARIKFVTMFSNAKDLDHHETFSSQMKKAVAGKDERRMTRPYSLAVNDKLVVVADPGSTLLHLFDKKKKTYRQMLNVGKYNFVSPIGVALGGDRLYIADSELKMVFILNLRFKLKKVLEGFQRPTSLAFDQVQNRLYVTDTLAHEIQVFDGDGDRLFKFGSNGKQDGQFNYPSHIAFADNRLFVNDTMNFRIQIFTGDGQHISTFGEHGVGWGYLAQPKGIAVDSEGHIYIADAIENHVQIFDQTGKFLLSFGQQGNAPGTFQMPTGLAIWNDNIFIADSYNGRVQIVQYLQGDQ